MTDSEFLNEILDDIESYPVLDWPIETDPLVYEEDEDEDVS